MTADQFNGPTEIGYAMFPGRGISYSGKYEGRDVHVSSLRETEEDADLC